MLFVNKDCLSDAVGPYSATVVVRVPQQKIKISWRRSNYGQCDLYVNKGTIRIFEVVRKFGALFTP